MFALFVFGAALLILSALLAPIRRIQRYRLSGGGFWLPWPEVAGICEVCGKPVHYGAARPGGRVFHLKCLRDAS